MSDETFRWDDHFLGSVTVGERGQIVIPAEARKRYKIEPGDKLLIMADPHKHTIMLCKFDTLQKVMSAFREGLEKIAQEPPTGSSGVSGAPISGAANSTTGNDEEEL